MSLNPADVPSRAGIQAAIDEVAADTGWSSMTTAGASGFARYRVIGKVVYVEVNVVIALPNYTTTVLVSSENGLPIAYRPSRAFGMAIGYMIGPSDGGPGYVIANTDGSISVVNRSGVTATSISGRYSYPMG